MEHELVQLWEDINTEIMHMKESSIREEMAESGIMCERKGAVNGREEKYMKLSLERLLGVYF